jgi:prepilin-type N-terminal cleavage/methylation domain-containing protein
MKKSQLQDGYTLVEMLVVIVIFATIAVVASQTLILTLRGTRKADAVSKVRQDVDYALGSMERQLRGAKVITSACTGTASPQISFTDQNGNIVTFACVGVNGSNQPSSIASSSGTLTSNGITISACSFTCTPGNGSSPTQVTMNITAKDLAGQNAPVSATTQVTLRSY